MNHRFLILLTIISFWLNGHPAFGNPKEQLRNANTLFHQQKYDASLEIWKGLLPKYASGNLFYNIGLAHSKLGQTPDAIYAFEQALRFHPGNHDYQNALKEERKKLDDATVPIRPFFLAQWVGIFLATFRPGTWVFLGLVLGLFAILASIPEIRNLFKIKNNLPSSVIKWIGATGILLVLIGILSYRQLYQENEAIVMKQCDIKQAASPESPPLRNVSAGEKVYLKDELGEWVYVSLLNLDYGWINKDCLQVIEIN